MSLSEPYDDSRPDTTEDQLARLCQRQKAMLDANHAEIWALKTERDICLTGLGKIIRESPCTLKMGCAECTARTTVRDAGGKI